MRDLHWLKITERIVYKLCLLVYKCHNNLAPKYLTELLPSRTSSRPLRSTHSVNITKAFFKNSQCQSSSFSSAGPRAWNSLPTRVKTAQSLNSFKITAQDPLIYYLLQRVTSFLNLIFFKPNLNLILILLSLF